MRQHNDQLARRAALLDAADRVISATGPAATMTAIAAEAGITKPILYRHFEDKAHLYRSLADRYVSYVLDDLRNGQAVPGTPRDRAREVIDTYLRFVEANPQIYRFLMQCPADVGGAPTVVSAFLRRIGSEIGDLLRDDFGLAGEDARIAEAWGQAVAGMLSVACDWWLVEQSLSRERFVDRLVTLLWDGLHGAAQLKLADVGIRL
jgi:AcrR family transcriptional regulator